MRPQGVAQVLEQAQAVAGHRQPVPAAEGPVSDGRHMGEAGGLAGQSAGELGPAAGLAEGPLDEVGVPDAVVLRWEPQVSPMCGRL